MLTEDQLTRTELQEIEDGIIKELALPVVSCKESATQDDDTWVRVKFD